MRDNRFETTNTRADVVFAFFGYNESFAGEAGLDKFKKDLDAFIKHTLAQKYNGKSAPRLVLFSPIAHEDLKSPNLPDGSENNKRLEMYTKAMAEVATAERRPLRRPVPPHARPVRQGGQAADHQRRPPQRERQRGRRQDHRPGALRRRARRSDDPATLEKLRQAVVDKNFYWFNRYRVMDGYNVYGGRAFEKYQNQQSNYEDQQRELEILDVMTANRDKRIWAVAQGKDLKVDDSNVPPYIPVETNQPGNGRRGTITFLDGEEAIKKMTVAKEHEGDAVRLGEGVPRAGQAGADAVRRAGPAVGGRLAELSALEARARR